MSINTLESISCNMTSKIKLLLALIKMAKKAKIKYNYEAILSLIYDYETGSLEVLTTYYKDLNNHGKYLSLFNAYIARSNYANKLDKHVGKLKQLMSKSADREKFNDLVAVYTEHAIICNIANSNRKLCPDCKIAMTYISNSSEMVCEQCGFSELVFGSAEDDEIIDFSNCNVVIPRKTKRGAYDPAKHRRLWIERIQARETVEINQYVIDKIKEFGAMDGLSGAKLTCSHIREYLHQLRFTQYNDHVPYIRKLITGISPPQFTEHELQLINNYSDKAGRIFEEIKPPNKSYCPYHPMFIFKIIDQILLNTSLQRKKEILSCIHLQSRETLIANDRLWKVICQRIPEFKYKPTDRNEYT